MADEHNAILNGGTEQGTEGNGQDNIRDNNAQVTKDLQSSGGDDKKLSTEKVKSEKVKKKKVGTYEIDLNPNPYFVRPESLIWANENGLQVHQFDYTKNQSITTSGFKTEVKSYGSVEECQKDALAKSYKTDSIVVVNRRIMEICTKRLKDKGLTLEYLNKDADSKEAKGFMIDLA